MIGEKRAKNVDASMILLFLALAKKTAGATCHHIIHSMGRSDKSSGLGSQRHDPLGVQLRTDTSGLLSAPGRRANKKHKKIAKEEDVSYQLPYTCICLVY